MKELVSYIEMLKKSPVSTKVSNRINEFSQVGTGDNDELFKELCFCLLTANFNAERGIKIQQEINNDFLTLSETALINRLKELGHRFPSTRAKFIFEAREIKSNLKNKVNSRDDEKLTRDWFVENVKGLGMKEASHFLRNVGFTDLAIIDFHIVDLLVKNGMIERPKTLTKKNYLEIEEVLKFLGKMTNLNMAELDLYLWFAETGKILK